MERTRMRTFGANVFDRQAKRGWFAETIVVLGILAFAYFAITLQPQSPEPILALNPVVGIG